MKLMLVAEVSIPVVLRTDIPAATGCLANRNRLANWRAFVDAGKSRWNRFVVKNVQVLDAEAELSMRGFIHHLKLLFLDLSP